MTKCKHCDSSSLEYKIDFEHEDVFTNKIIVDDGYLCSDCGCFHYKENKGISYEYEVSTMETFKEKKINYVTDYDKKLMEKTTC